MFLEWSSESVFCVNSNSAWSLGFRRRCWRISSHCHGVRQSFILFPILFTVNWLGFLQEFPLLLTDRQITSGGTSNGCVVTGRFPSDDIQSYLTLENNAENNVRKSTLRLMNRRWFSDGFWGFFCHHHKQFCTSLECPLEWGSGWLTRSFQNIPSCQAKPNTILGFSKELGVWKRLRLEQCWQDDSHQTQTKVPLKACSMTVKKLPSVSAPSPPWSVS